MGKVSSAKLIFSPCSNTPFNQREIDMNIEHAKSIPLSEILVKLGIKPEKETSHDIWYLSPLRNEKTASFHIDKHKNVWFDFGLNQGGNIIAFVCAYLESTNENNTVPDALRWIKNMMAGENYPVIKDRFKHDVEIDRKILFKNAKPIKHPALELYLKSRGIDLDIARSYLQEVRFSSKDSAQIYFALGFKNEAGGYELRNQKYKGCIRPKDITFIRGAKPKPDGIVIFEGVMDYLSIMTQRGGEPLDDDVMVLNSITSMKKAFAYIKNYGYKYGYTWLDNNPAGHKTTQALKEFFKAEEMLHYPMNDIYKGHDDVNAWQMYRLGLTP